MILFIIFLVLHFTGRLRYSNQAVMAVTALCGIFIAACGILVISFLDLPLQLRIIIGLLIAAPFALPFLWQNIFPADEYSFRRLPSSDERLAVGIRRLLVSGTVSTIVFSVMAAIFGILAFAAQFALNFISGVTAAHFLVTVLSLGSGFGFFVRSALVNLAAGIGFMSAETLFECIKGFFEIILIFTYVYLINGILRYSFTFRRTWSDRIPLLIIGIIPIANIILGIVLAVRVGITLKKLRGGEPDTGKKQKTFIQ